MSPAGTQPRFPGCLLMQRRGEAQQRAPARDTRQSAALARGQRARQRQPVPRILFSLPSPGTGSCPVASVSPAPRDSGSNGQRGGQPLGKPGPACFGCFLRHAAAVAHLASGPAVWGREGGKERGFVRRRTPARQRQRPPATSHRGGVAPPTLHPTTPKYDSTVTPATSGAVWGQPAPHARTWGAGRALPTLCPPPQQGRHLAARMQGGGVSQHCQGCATVSHATSYSRMLGSHGRCIPLGTRGPLSKRRDPHNRQCAQRP